MTLNNSSNSIQEKKAIPFYIDCIYMFLVLLVCFKLTYDVLNIVDFMFADESFYLHTGASFRFMHLFKDGGFYYLWLKLIVLFTPNLEYAYCINYAILISINPVLMYILFRKFRRSSFVSAFFAIFFQVSLLNITTWPFITRFSSAIILLTMILLFSVKKPLSRFFVLFFLLFILVYTRPEFALGFLLFCLGSLCYYLYSIFKDRKLVKAYLPLVVLLIISAIFVLVIKNPAVSGRSMFAFGQHYGSNLEKSGQLKNLDAWTDWKEILKQKFNTDDSLVKAFINNPGELMRHISMNVRQFPKDFFYQLFPFHTLYSSFFIKQVVKYFIIFLFIVPVVFFIFSVFSPGAKFFSVGATCRLPVLGLNFRASGRTPLQSPDKFLYLFSFLVLLPVLFSLFVIFPRTHHMLSLFCIVLPLLVMNLPFLKATEDTEVTEEDVSQADTIKNFWSNLIKSFWSHLFTKRWAAGGAFFIFLVFIYFIPFRVSGKVGFMPPPTKTLCTYVYRVIQIKKVPVASEVRLIEMVVPPNIKSSYFQQYLSDRSPFPYTTFRLEPSQSFESLVLENRINMIYVNSILLDHFRVRSLLTGTASLEEIIEQFTQSNWTRIDVNGCKEYILIKDEILKKK